jgi:putative ABC transport system permease protein
MSRLWVDLRHAVRALGTRPAYTITALLTLTIGIGFNTAIFTVVHAVLLQPLPYADADRLVLLRERRLPQFPEFSVSVGNFLTWQAQSRAFEGMAAHALTAGNLEAPDGEVQRVRADRVTSSLFDVLGVRPALGAPFSAEHDRAGGPRAIILSHGLWQRRFGGAAGVIGQTLRFNSLPYTIAGVMPAGFAYPSADTEVWLPMALSAQEVQDHGSHYLGAVARLRPGVTLEQARTDLQSIAKRLSETRPGSNNGWEALAFPMHEYLVQKVKRALLVLLGAVGLVLLIACVNVANLLLARGTSRRRELAIRAAVGAGRGQLIRQLLTESLVLSMGGAFAGLLLAAWLLRFLLALIPGTLPREADIALDRTVLLFTLGLAVVTPLLFGLLPALFASRADLRELLAAGGRQGGATTGARTRTVLVVAEIALALVLLVGAGLLMRSFAKVQGVDPGFDPSRALLAGLTLPAADYPDPAQRTRFFLDVAARLASLPHVAAAGVTQSVPLVNDFVASYDIEGRPAPSPTERPTTNFYAVSPGYFAAMGIEVRRGRAFGEQDRAGATRVAIINETLARRAFGGEDPIGRRIQIAQGPNSRDFREIVGVVEDATQYGVTLDTPAQIYEPLAQHQYFGSVTLVVRTHGEDPLAVAPDVRAILREMDSRQALARVRTLEEVLAVSMMQQRFSAILFAVFSGAALLLAAIGLYGVLAYVVGQRTQELAIRVAHGATRRDIMRLVLGDGLRMSIAGVGVGLLGALLMGGLLEGLLHGVSPFDPWTFATVALLLATVSLLACALPALRATRVDPLEALRG